MKFGFIVPIGGVHEILDLAQEIEAAGWDGFFTWDGIGGRAWDPWTMLGAVALRTERIALGAMLFPLSRRRPWKVAHEANTVDHLSNGRLVIPVGLGAVDNPAFANVRPEVTDRKTRAELLDETLEILGKAFTGKPFSHAGTHYQVDNLSVEPPSVQQPRIPIWVVGAWPRPKSMRRAARWDGVMPSLADDPFRPLTPGDVAAVRDWMIAHRDNRTTGEIVLEGVSPGDDATWVDGHLRPLADAGATWWIESRWEAPNDIGTLRARVRQGPPRL